MLGAILRLEGHVVARVVEFTENSVILHLSGFQRLASLKKHVEIPYASIKSVSIDAFKIPNFQLSIGLSIADIRAGRFMLTDKWSFISYEHHKDVVILQLINHQFKNVVFQIKNPEAMKNQIVLHISRWKDNDYLQHFPLGIMIGIDKFWLLRGGTHLELLYVWVQNFRNIKQLGFSFSDKFKISFEQASKKEKRKLTIEKNTDDEPFFEGKIDTVTAIIGKNGSGKTNLLDLLGMRMEERRNSQQDSYFLVYHLEDMTFESSYYITQKE